AQVPAIRHTHHDRATEGVVRAPAHRGELIAELVVRRPDVVEELDLHDRLQPARCEADRATHDARFSKGRVVHAIAPELPLQSPGDFEDAAFSLHFWKVLLTARV